MSRVSSNKADEARYYYLWTGDEEQLEYNNTCEVNEDNGNGTKKLEKEFLEGYRIEDVLSEEYAVVWLAFAHRLATRMYRSMSGMRRRLPQRRIRLPVESIPKYQTERKLRSRRGSTCQRLCILSTALLLVGALPSLMLSSAGSARMYGSRPLWADDQQSSRWTVSERLRSFSTTDIKPLPCISHNDESRPVPLFTGLSHGCMAVEADIWLREHKLLVGHDAKALRAEDTLFAMYLEPLLQILQGQTGQPHVVGRVYEQQDEASEPFMLMLDFKSQGPDGPDTLRALEAALEPFREADLLTHLDRQSVSLIRRPLIIVASGDVPFDMLTSAQHNTHNDIFFDAPLRWIWETSTGRVERGREPGRGQGRAGTSKLDSAALFDTSNSYLASMSFKSLYWPPFGGLSKQQEIEIKEQIEAAHAKGLKVRYWGTWDSALRPVGRRRLWRQLTKLGVDIMNVDAIADFAFGEWRDAA